MVLKVVVFASVAVALAAISFSQVVGGPIARAGARADSVNEEMLEKSFAEYLRHDPELVKKLEQLQALAPEALGGGGAHRRVRRQEIDESTLEVEAGAGDADKQPGFFDRAAKFVVELLQRFLRWVNTDSS